MNMNSKLLIVTAVDNGMVRKEQKHDFRISSDYRKKLELPLRHWQILGVAGRVSWQGRRLQDVVLAINSISPSFTIVFHLFRQCVLFQRCISPSLCLDSVADSCRSLIARWIMLGLAQTDSSGSTDHLVGRRWHSLLYFNYFKWDTTRGIIPP